MTKVSVRVVGVLAALTLALVLVPSINQPAHAETVYALWVGGIPVTSTNAADILGDRDEGATASYDDSTKTLTLNNYSYESEGYRFGAYDNLYAAIYAEQDLNIQLEGDNTVKCAETEGALAGNGIYSGGKDLAISGSGTLTVAGYGESGFGIYTYAGDITINSGTVTASGALGLAVDGGKIIINGGIVTASGSDKGFSGDAVTVAGDVGINAGDSKESAVDVDKADFKTNHPQKWVQVAKAYNLWVGGKRVLVSNASNITGGDTVTASYDAQTHTLTLDNYSYTGPGSSHSNANFSVFNDVDDKNFTVELIGDNYLETTSVGHFSHGIHHGKARLSITFTGDGNLKIVSKQATVFNNGISSNGDIVIGGPNLDIDAGSKGYGIYCQMLKSVSIESGSLTAKGGDGAISGSGTVKNFVAGLGWTNIDGTEGKTYIDVNTQGQGLDSSIQHVKFPAPVAAITVAPTAESLTYNGSAQELVTAGVAEDGEVQYALGTDAVTEPTSGWSASIPQGTDAGDYYVWYKAVGDSTHGDSEAYSVMVTINKAPLTPSPTPSTEPTPTAGPTSTAPSAVAPVSTRVGVLSATGAEIAGGIAVAVVVLGLGIGMAVYSKRHREE